jgi:hypothetical protein
LLNDIAGNLPPLGCDAVRVGATYSTYRRDHSEGGDILREWDNRDMDRYDRRGFNSR